MRELHLLRHAKSSWDDPRLADFDRPLNDRGRRAAAAMADHIRRAGPRPSLVLCSPAARARETLEVIAPALDGAATVFDARLYEADAEDLLARLRALPAGEPGPVLLLGHNPGLQRLALKLLARDNDLARRMRRKYPTGALASFACEVDSWAELGGGTCRLRAFVRPKDLA